MNYFIHSKFFCLKSTHHFSPELPSWPLNNFSLGQIGRMPFICLIFQDVKYLAAQDFIIYKTSCLALFRPSHHNRLLVSLLLPPLACTCSNLDENFLISPCMMSAEQRIVLYLNHLGGVVLTIFTLFLDFTNHMFHNNGFLVILISQGEQHVWLWDPGDMITFLILKNHIISASSNYPHTISSFFLSHHLLYVKPVNDKVALLNNFTALQFIFINQLPDFSRFIPQKCPKTHPAVSMSLQTQNFESSKARSDTWRFW